MVQTTSAPTHGTAVIAILLGLILWGMLWGTTGVLLSTPILVVMKSLFERIEGSEPLAGRLAKLRSPDEGTA